MITPTFTLARFDRDPSLTFQVYFYEESVATKPIAFKGLNGVQIELSSHYSVMRALLDGWTDITKLLSVVDNSKKLDIPIKEVDETKAKRKSRKSK